MDPYADRSQRAFIRTSMQEKDTEELISIWQNKDTNEWKEETFEIVEEILLERLGKLPERSVGNERYEPGDEEYDTYHDPERLEKIATRAGQVAIGFLVVTILLFVYIIVYAFVVSRGMTLTQLILTFFPSGLVFFALILVCGFFYVVLKSIEEGLYLLMDIEANTRPNNTLRKV